MFKCEDPYLYISNGKCFDYWNDNNYLFILKMITFVWKMS